MIKRIALVSLLVLSIAGYSIASCNTIDILTESLPLFFTGHTYSVQLEPCCGTAPYTFSVYSGTLPPGLAMNSSGLISGSPSVAPYNDIFCVTVTDSVGCHVTRCYDATSSN